MVRLIQREIKDKLADEIWFGQLNSGGKVKIARGEEGLGFTIAPKTNTPAPPVRGRKAVRQSEPVKS
jgi:hypothetical protein